MLWQKSFQDVQREDSKKHFSRFSIGIAKSGTGTLLTTCSKQNPGFDFSCVHWKIQPILSRQCNMSLPVDSEMNQKDEVPFVGTVWSCSVDYHDARSLEKLSRDLRPMLKETSTERDKSDDRKRKEDTPLLVSNETVWGTEPPFWQTGSCEKIFISRRVAAKPQLFEEPEKTEDRRGSTTVISISRPFQQDHNGSFMSPTLCRASDTFEEVSRRGSRFADLTVQKIRSPITLRRHISPVFPEGWMVAIFIWPGKGWQRKQFKPDVWRTSANSDLEPRSCRPCLQSHSQSC